MKESNVPIKGEFIELLKLIKLMSWTNTGGEAKVLIDNGLITVNGERESRYRAKLRRGDVVVFENEKVNLE